MTGLTAETPEGPAVVVPTMRVPAVAWSDRNSPHLWVLVEYPDGRRRYWRSDRITVRKTAKK